MMKFNYHPFQDISIELNSRTFFLTSGHANLFIPSTLGGDPMETSTVNKEILQKILEFATEVYINYVSKYPRVISSF